MGVSVGLLSLGLCLCKLELLIAVGSKGPAPCHSPQHPKPPLTTRGSTTPLPLEMGGSSVYYREVSVIQWLVERIPEQLSPLEEEEWEEGTDRMWALLVFS